MKIKIEKNYLILPTNRFCKNKKLYFFEQGREVYALNVKLDSIDPDFYAFIDMRRFRGKTLEMKIIPEMPITFKQADEMTGEFHDSLRPYFHFSPKRGWMNDPNGLIMLDGIYHMFYQYNPASRGWDNMHWGHAVSRDLIHWKEEGIALFPDSFGSVFSGGAVIDKNNLLGKQKDGNQTALLFYTAAGSHATIPVPFTQCMAYSVDGLRSFHKFEGNPILPNIIEKNRDPAVVWCEELNRYLLTIWLNENNYGIYASDDLISWKHLQTVEISGESECPNLFPLQCGADDRKWILIGANEIYLVGEFRNGKFVPVQREKHMFTGQSDGYAAQMYTDLPDGRIVRIAWGKWRNFCAKTFCSQMSIPCDVRLKKCGTEYFLSYAPAAELDTILLKTDIYENICTTSDKPLHIPMHRCAAGIKLSGSSDGNAVYKIISFGIEILADLSKNEITVGGYTQPLFRSGKKLDVEMIIDRTSIEVFCDDGKIAFMVCNSATADENLPYIEIYSPTSSAIERIEIKQYDSIWHIN